MQGRAERMRWSRPPIDKEGSDEKVLLPEPHSPPPFRVSVGREKPPLPRGPPPRGRKQSAEEEMVEPNEVASNPLMSSIVNFRLSAKDFKKKLTGLPWGERWRLAKRMKRDAENIR